MAAALTVTQAAMIAAWDRKRETLWTKTDTARWLDDRTTDELIDQIWQRRAAGRGGCQRPKYAGAWLQAKRRDQFNRFHDLLAAAGDRDKADPLALWQRANPKGAQ